jgi:succinyl-diaminopimelate desuccinylase
MSESLALAQALIHRRSVSPDDAGCMDLIAGRLEPLGFNIEWLDRADTRNIWLRRGERAPLFVFLGHTDVVPSGPENDWASPPFEPQIRDGLLYGRGAADMKSSIAAFVTACERFLQQHPDHNRSIAVLLTSDEEGAAINGTAKVVETLEARHEKIDWCLVGEPSSRQRLGDTIRVGRRGSLCARMIITGIQGHVAYPDLADNPIHRFAPALHALTQERWDEGNEHFPPTSLQISNINAGTGAENIIPGSVDVQFNLRFSSEIDEISIKERIHGLLDGHELEYEIEWRLSGNPFLTRETELLGAAQSALMEVTGHPARLDTGGGTSDGRFVAPTGAQVIELGTINESIHKVNECVSVADIDTLSCLYERVLFNLLVACE